VDPGVSTPPLPKGATDAPSDVDGSGRTGDGRLRVALVFNVRGDESDSQDCRPSDRDDTYIEWDVWPTINSMRDALALHHEVILVEHDGHTLERIRNAAPDLVFNFAEGLEGAHRESVIPMICEMLGVPYTGADPLSMGLCLDKVRTKQILMHHGVPTPDYFIVEPDESDTAVLPWPAIVKPVHEGSSKGIFDASLVRDRGALRSAASRVHADYRQPALVERFLPGREFTVSVLGNHPEARCFPIVELDYSGMPNGANPIYSFEAKWVWDTADRPLDLYRCPADVGPALKDRIEHTTLEAVRALAVHDWCRVDLRLDENDEPHVIEINPIPGLLPNPHDHSLYTTAAREAGTGYVELVNEIARVAARRWGLVRA
jgi:D-alanine-D-alanine ligase